MNRLPKLLLRRAIWSSAVASFVALTPGTADAGWFDTHAAPTCSVTFGDRALHFAHCDGAERDFGSVIVAIPGWNGSCEQTFGQGAASLYSVLDKSRFFDWDCYDYDSHNWHIQQSADGLSHQISSLKTLGYKNVLFLTHSTGGIVVLEYISERLFPYVNGAYSRAAKPTDNLPDVLMPEALLWAAPINGLNWYISDLGNFSGDDEKTLPDLQQDSSYLAGLKHRLADYHTWLQSLPADEARLAGISLNFLQSDNDGVVVSIDGSGPRPAWLWPSPEGEVIKTRLSHLDISNNGTGGALQDNAYLDKLVAVSKAPLDIRLKNVFSDAQATQLAVRRQDEVVQGVTYYSKEQFGNALIPTLRLMRFMLETDFVRGAHIDENVVDDLLSLYDQKLADPQIEGEAALLLAAADTHDFGTNSPTVAGRNAPEYVRKVADLLEKIRLTATSANPLSDETNSRVLSAESRIATTTAASDVRDHALEILEAEIMAAPSKAITTSLALDGLFASYYPANASNLPDSSKSLMAAILKAGIERGGDVQKATLSLINSNVMFENRTQPLWRSLQQDDFTDYLNKFAKKQSGEAVPKYYSPDLLSLDLSMLKGVGTAGRSPHVAYDALERLKEALPLASPETKALFIELNGTNKLTDIDNWPQLRVDAAPIFKSYGAILR